jgi:FHA domain
LIASAARPTDENAPSAERAYKIALAAHRARDLNASVCWLTDQAMASRDLADDGHFVIGRHTECDAILEKDATVSLRHLLVRVTHSTDGAPGLSILDLRTEAGFLLSDGTPQRSIETTGPVVLRVGVHTIVAIPRGPWPDELPTPEIVGTTEVPKIAARRVREARSVSRITMNTGVRHVTERASVAGDDWELELESARAKAAVWISNTDLGNGVLIGRAERCVDEGLRRALDLDVSRVHALLLRTGDETRLFDLASTQGTYVDGHKIRSVVMESGAHVTLAKRNKVDLRWRRA